MTEAPRQRQDSFASKEPIAVPGRPAPSLAMPPPSIVPQRTRDSPILPKASATVREQPNLNLPLTNAPSIPLPRSRPESISSAAPLSAVEAPVQPLDSEEALKAAMSTAAERAKKRRQEEEAEREALKERARKKAAELEARMKAERPPPVTPVATEPVVQAVSPPPKVRFIL